MKYEHWWIAYDIVDVKLPSLFCFWVNRWIRDICAFHFGWKVEIRLVMLGSPNRKSWTIHPKKTLWCWKKNSFDGLKVLKSTFDGSLLDPWPPMAPESPSARCWSMSGSSKKVWNLQRPVKPRRYGYYEVYYEAYYEVYMKYIFWSLYVCIYIIHIYICMYQCVWSIDEVYEHPLSKMDMF